MNESDESDDTSFCDRLVNWLIKRGLWRPNLRVIVTFLILGAGLWYLNSPAMKQENDDSVQSIEEIRSSAVNRMKKIYQLSKCETDWLDNIQEGNLGQRISATKELLKEVERLSIQITDIWKPGVALGFECIE